MWTSIEFIHNTNAPNLGTLVATHDSGFTFSKDRVNVANAQERTQFSDEAKAALTASVSNRTRFDSAKSTILALLNG